MSSKQISASFHDAKTLSEQPRNPGNLIGERCFFWEVVGNVVSPILFQIALSACLQQL